MDEAEGKKAFTIHEKIVSNEEVRRMLMAENAKLLNEMYEQDLYKTILGAQDAEWAGYLGQVEIYYTRSKVNYLVRIYRRYTTELGIDESIWIQAPLTRLMDILHIINKENYEDWISKALVLTTRDWNIEVRKAKGKTTEDDDHKHDNQTYDICTKCGKKEKHHHDQEIEITIDTGLSVPRPTLFKKK